MPPFGGARTLLPALTLVPPICRFLPKDEALMCFRFGKQRAQSHDVAGVGPYMRFNICPSRRSPGICTFQLQVAIVHVNGATGNPNFGMYETGHPMKLLSVRNTFVERAKRLLPKNHVLRVKGWDRLPTTHDGIGSWRLSDAVAIPGPPGYD